MIWCCEEVHQHPHEPYRSPSPLLFAVYAICMQSPKCYSISCPGRPYSSPGSDCDPCTCAVFAKVHNLLNTPGWKLLKRHARTARRLIRTLKKSKYRQARASRKYKHGWEVPRDYAHALQLDIHNGNNKWKEAIDLEI